MDEILFEVDGHVATIELNRPSKLNAVTPAMSMKLRGLVERCNNDDSIRVVIVTGAGQKSFCVGSDIGELDTYQDPWRFRNRIDYCDAVRGLRKPAIAAVNGYALGGGLELAMSCDIRILSATACLGAPEVKLGWVGGGGQATFLTHSAGPSNAAVMLMTGDPVSADRALSWGLASDVVEPEDLMRTVRALALSIGERPPIAIETAKLNVRAAYSMPQDAAVQYERDLQAICMATEDAAEGRAAFKEKRTPTFLGR